MIPLIFIIIIVGISLFLNYRFSSEVTWMVYFRAVFIGMLASGFILKLWNYKKFKDELKKEQDE